REINKFYLRMRALGSIISKSIKTDIGINSLFRSLGLSRMESNGAYRFGSFRGSVRFGLVRFGSVRFGLVWFGSVRFGSVLFGSDRFGSVRNGLDLFAGQHYVR